MMKAFAMGIYGAALLLFILTESSRAGEVDTANGTTLCLYDGAAWQTATSTLDSDCA
jgi:hypothetical protein